jgi:murein DD-endopeptidase MepM/ murein hydrolase activator NlpD
VSLAVVQSRVLKSQSLPTRRTTIGLAFRTRWGVLRFSLPLLPVAAVVAFAVVMPLLVGLGARWSAHATISELQTQNALLRMENASYREATGQLASQISSLQTAVDDIGARAKVDPSAQSAINRLPERVRARAMGGASLSAPLLSGAFPDQAFAVLRDLLGVMETRLLSVRSGVERRQALAAATPSMWPLAGWITSSYGNRTDPFNGDADFHPGLDISASHGQEIYSPADGVVESAAVNGSYGNLITIAHGFGITTRYGHLSRYAVATGQPVRRGQVIGFVGSTGRSTSPHLHYEVLVNGQLTNPLRLLAGR